MGHIHISSPDNLPKTSVDFYCTAARPYDESKAPDPKVRWLNVWHDADVTTGWKCRHCGHDFRKR